LRVRRSLTAERADRPYFGDGPQVAAAPGAERLRFRMFRFHRERLDSRGQKWAEYNHDNVPSLFAAAAGQNRSNPAILHWIWKRRVGDRLRSGQPACLT